MHDIILMSEGPQYNVIISSDVKYETKGTNGKTWTEASFQVACGNGAKKKEDGTFESKESTFFNVQVTGERNVKHLQAMQAGKGFHVNLRGSMETWYKKKDDGSHSNGSFIKVGGDGTLFVYKPQTKEQLQQPQQNVQQNTQPAQQNTQYAPQQGYQQPYNNGPVNNGYPQQGYQQPYNGPANGGYAPNYQQQPYNNGYPAQAQTQPAQNVGGSGRLDISSNNLPFY